nr:hypothetical protein Iba_chr12aCG8490 [Ipomoea batatas]
MFTEGLDSNTLKWVRERGDQGRCLQRAWTVTPSNGFERFFAWCLDQIYSISSSVREPFTDLQAGVYSVSNKVQEFF